MKHPLDISTLRFEHAYTGANNMWSNALPLDHEGAHIITDRDDADNVIYDNSNTDNNNLDSTKPSYGLYI